MAAARKPEPPAANGIASPSNASPELATLLSAAEMLLGSPAADGYSSNQKRAIVAFALRLQDPRLGEVLGRLHQLAILSWNRGCKSADPALLKTLAVLLDVRIGAADSFAGAVIWRLARERTWRREARLRALALLLKCAVATEEELLKAALKAAPSLAASALALLCEVEPGASLLEARQAVVMKLAGSKLPAPVEASILPILGALLECEASAQKVLAQLPGAGWASDTVEAAKQLAAKAQSDATAAAEKLDASTLRSILREPRDKQVARLATVLQVPKDEKLPEVAVLKALADLAEKVPAPIARAALGVAIGCQLSTAPADKEDEDSAAAKSSVEALARHICERGAKHLQAHEARLQASACLFQAPQRIEAVLQRLARASSAGSASASVCRELAECLLIGVEGGKEGKPVPASRAVLLAALEKVKDLPQDAQKVLAEAVKATTTAPAAPRTPPKSAPGKAAAAAKPPAGKASAKTATAPAPGAKAAAAQEMTAKPKSGATPEATTPAAKPKSAPAAAAAKSSMQTAAAAKPKAAPAAASAASETTTAAKSKSAPAAKSKAATPEIAPPRPKVPASATAVIAKVAAVKAAAKKASAPAPPVPSSAEEEGGWSALKALVEAESEEERGEEGDEAGEAEGWDALKALVEDEEDDDDNADGAEAKQSSAPTMSKKDKGSRADAKVRRQETVSSGLREEGSAGDEEDEDGAEGEEAGEVDEDNDASESEASYGGSELDPLDFRGGFGATNDNDDEADEEDDDAGGGSSFDLGSGVLLTSMFGGGSLHSEDKVKRRGQVHHKPTKIRVVFPSLIWRGKDVLVVNKPADWICSASDVDKKKGRKLDPHEKCLTMNFHTLEDLLQHKFQEREKKYIHWWIQLMHDLDKQAYPNLFDEDQNYGLCHRLDRETSGTVLVGLTQLARQQMRECFHRHYVRKLYVCLAHGKVESETVDKNLEAMGQKARLHPSGKRARTDVKVLAYFTKADDHGGTETFSLCTCEIAEGRMHQIRLHLAQGLYAPIVSEFYYQKPRQMIEDRRWCQRVFLHAYAMGFPDVSGEVRRVGNENPDGEKCGLVDEDKRDAEQEWHCCICPLTKELRNALQEITPMDEVAKQYKQTIIECGLLDPKHESVHVMGTESRKTEIDERFFPWSSKINPIDAGDLHKPREEKGKGFGKGKWKYRDKGGGKGNDGGGDGDNATKAKAKPRRRLLPDRHGDSASPRGRGGHSDGPGSKRLRISSRPGRDGEGRLERSRSGSIPTLGPRPSLRGGGPGRRGRSASRGRSSGGGGSLRGRPPGGPPSPRGRSHSLGRGRKRRRGQSASHSPPNGGRAPPLRSGRAGKGEGKDRNGRKGRDRD